MTQKYQVKVSMKQAAIVETGIVLKQGDFGMQIEIEVLDFDATGTTPQIVFRKAMGAVESTTITVSGNKYTYTFKGTELDTPGKCFCDLKLKNSTTQRISTASFMFRVIADTMDGLEQEASSYSDTIEQIVGSFETDMVNVKSGIDNKSIIGISFDRINIADFAKKINATVSYNSKLKWIDTLTYLPVIGEGEDIVIDFAWNDVNAAFINAIRYTKGATQTYVNYTAGVGGSNSTAPLSGYIASYQFTYQRMCISVSKDEPYILIRANLDSSTTEHEIKHWVREEDIKSGSISERTLGSDVVSKFDDLYNGIKDYVDGNIINKSILGINFDRINITDFVEKTNATVSYNSKIAGYNTNTYLPVIQNGEDIVIDFAWDDMSAEFINAIKYTKGSTGQTYVNYTENVGVANSTAALSGFIAPFQFSYDRMCICISKNEPYILVRANLDNSTTEHEIKYWVREEDIKSGSISERTLGSDVTSKFDNVDNEIDFLKESITNKGLTGLNFDRINIMDFVKETNATVSFNSKLKWVDTNTYLPVIGEGEDIVIDFAWNDMTAAFIDAIRYTKGATQTYVNYTAGVGGSNSTNPLTGFIAPFQFSYDRMCICVSKDAPYILARANFENSITEHEIKHWIRIEDLRTNIQPLSVTVGIFNSIGFIGDSYTGGAIVRADGTWTGTGPNRTWTAQMCKRNGVANHNYGYGGASTRSYITLELPTVLADDPWDFYTLALGINDEWSLGLDYIGSVEDIKEDYHDNPDTFFGNYARIIEQIMGHAPNAKFCMIKMQNRGEYHAEFNTAIAQIAAHYGFPVIDPFDDFFFNTTTYLNMVGGHPTLLGYSGMSLAYERLLSKCIVDNPVYFRYSGIV